jgi:hypothetical protein
MANEFRSPLGHRFYALDASGGVLSGMLLPIGIDMPGQRDHAVPRCDPNVIGAHARLAGHFREDARLKLVVDSGPVCIRQSNFYLAPETPSAHNATMAEHIQNRYYKRCRPSGALSMDGL